MSAPWSRPHRSPTCVACGASPAITAATLPTYDYAAFTGQAASNDAAPTPLQLIPREERITPAELRQRWVGLLADARRARRPGLVDSSGSKGAVRLAFGRQAGVERRTELSATVCAASRRHMLAAGVLAQTTLLVQPFPGMP